MQVHGHAARGARRLSIPPYLPLLAKAVMMEKIETRRVTLQIPLPGRRHPGVQKLIQVGTYKTRRFWYTVFALLRVVQTIRENCVWLRAGPGEVLAFPAGVTNFLSGGGGGIHVSHNDQSSL